MINVVVKDFFRVQNSRFINGGSQYARNLINGLRAQGLELTVVSWSSEDSPEAQIISGDSDFGPYLSISGLKGPSTWKDENATRLIRTAIQRISTEPSIFHLIETDFHLGSWLEALKESGHKIVVTALDYTWLCARSHLLKADSSQCRGPENGADCVRCFYDHRSPLKAAAQRMISQAARIDPITALAPAKVQSRLRAVQEHQKITETRYDDLSGDLGRVDAIIAMSLSVHYKFMEFGFPSERSFYIPNGTIAGDPVPLAARPPLENGIVFGFCGKLTFDKGLDLALEALEQIRRETPHRPKLIVFSSPHPSGFGQEVMRRIGSAACRDWVSMDQYNGRDGADIDRAHAKFHCQIIPSRWTDNRPNAALECLARHTPLVAPAYGSFLELIETGINGWSFTLNNVRSLKNTLLRILEQPREHLDLPFNIQKVRTLEDESKDILGVYERVLPGAIVTPALAQCSA